MPDLTTRFAGLEMPTPIVLGSAGTSETVERMLEAESRGAGAVVMKSLFELEVTRKAPRPCFRVLKHDLGKLKTFTLYSYEQASVWGPERYAAEIARAGREVRIPVFVSINCYTPEGWTEYARVCEGAGADAIELNVSCPHSSLALSAGDLVIEEVMRVTEMVRNAVRVPLVVKLPPQLTAPPAAVKAAAEAGADGVVMFNRHTGLDIDVQAERPVMHGGYAGHGGPWAIGLPLRWISAVSPSAPIPISGSGGVTTGDDVVKFLLAGATTVQVCTAVYLEGFKVLQDLKEGLESWMASKGYESIDDFRGKVSGDAVLDVNRVDRSQDRTYFIDLETCTGCRRCAEICIYGAPKPAGDGKKYAIGRECVGCGLCAELCPVGAIAPTD